jgi:cytoskeletal protein CcmA (bactofilin family)
MNLTAFLTIILSLATSGYARLVTSGSYKVRSGTSLPGNLMVTAGQIEIEEGARVDGSVLMTSGKLTVNGAITGHILMTSGKVRLGSDAVVAGNIWRTSGSVHQDPGARVLGSASTRVTGADDEAEDLKWKEKAVNTVDYI